jgi:predicted RND superfamily exporter protein
VASLGVVMALGVGSNLVAALWVLPAVLDRTVRNR